MKRRTPNDRKALPARLADRRASLQQERGAKPDSRLPWLLVAILALLLMLALFCGPTPTPPPVPPAPPCTVAVELLGPATAPPQLQKTPRIGRIDRPEYTNPAPDPLPWLVSFRMQVAARAPRLAQCFVGVERPGALKWTAAVEPKSGRVSDHTLETSLESVPLTKEQTACVLGVLSDPSYKLELGAERSTPPRVAVAIEF